MALPGLLAAGALYFTARTIPRPPSFRSQPPRVGWMHVWHRGRGFGALIVLRNFAASLLTLPPLVWHQRGGSPTQSGAVVAVV